MDLSWSFPKGALPLRGSIARENPAGMAFVFRRERSALPAELAKLHVPWIEDERALVLAPYAIDDATDTLFEHRLSPRAIFYLAARDLPGLFWGLHDWVHFHNHGPFEQRAWTEFQCDMTARAWLALNACAISMPNEVGPQIAALSAERFHEEGITIPSFAQDILEACAGSGEAFADAVLLRGSFSASLRAIAP